MPKTMTDEERYGKVGAEIRKLDPEAYKNRPGTAEGNMKLLKELRAKAAKSSSREADSEDYTTNRPKRASSSDKSELNTFESGKKDEAPKKSGLLAPTMAVGLDLSRGKQDRIAAQRENAARSAARDAEAAAERMARDKPPAPKVTPRAAAPTSATPSDRIAAQRVNAARSAARDAEAAAERMARDRPPTAEQIAAGRARRDREDAERLARDRPFGMKSGGSVYRRAADGITQRGKTKGTEVRMARGGSVSSASKRADGCAMKGKTKGRFV